MATEEKDETFLSQIQPYINWIKRNGMQKIGIPTFAIFASLIFSGNGIILWDWLVGPIWKLLLTIMGTAVGVGLGLGLAIHVHDHLESMSDRNSSQKQKLGHLHVDTSNRGQLKKPLLTPTTSTASAWAEEDNTYASLMNTAGYNVSDQILRGQVVKEPCNFLNIIYPFTDEPDANKWTSVVMMRDQWPTLPDRISLEIGKFMEHIMRDFVSSWYQYMDGGVVYEEERSKRKRLEEMKDETSAEEESEENMPPSHAKTMIFSTVGHRSAPMMTAIYQSFSIVFGNLSTRVEGVNLFSLVLIKWTKVLSQSFRVYRKIRREVVSKYPSAKKYSRQQSNRSDSKQDLSALAVAEEDSEEKELKKKVSEMSMVREFMKKGKLHRAITFGIDVPSLLFGDAQGEDCGLPKGIDVDNDTNEDGESLPSIEDQVFEKRLFDGNMLKECELDYNRVLSHRLLRALLPREEFSSPIIRTAMTEMLAGCILTPLMGSFTPEAINDMIIMGCADAPKTDDKEEQNEEKNSRNAVESEGNNLESNELKAVASKPSNSLEGESNLDDISEEINVAKSLKSLNRSNEKPSDDGAEMTMGQANLFRGSSQNGFEMTMSQTDFFKDKDEEVIVDSDEHKDESAALDNHEELEGSSTSLQSSSILGEDSKPLEIDNVAGPEDNLQREALSSQDESGSEHEKSNEENNEEQDEDTDGMSSNPPTGDFVLPLLTMSLIELQRFIDFQEWRDADQNDQEIDVKWEDRDLQTAITQLVLTIEAVLLHGRRKFKLEDGIGEEVEEKIDINESEKAIEIAIPTKSLSTTLMEITSDPDDFEDTIMQEEEEYMDSMQQNDKENGPIEIWEATSADLSTLRSLIAAWLHTGQAHRIMSVFINAQHSTLKPFFYGHAFLRTRETAEGFVRQLRQLNGVHLYVDTLVLLAAPSMDVNEDGKIVIPKPEAKARLQQSLASSTEHQPPQLEKEDSSKRKLGARFGLRGQSIENITDSERSTAIQVPGQPMTLPQAYISSSGLPRFVDFRRNENFASSLRSERERRMYSWATTGNKMKGLPIICRKHGTTEASIAQHRDIHHVSRVFYAGTNLVALRTGSRRIDNDSTDKEVPSSTVPLGLLTVEMACQRRRLEVPDDDSSFLLRAQPRPLNAIGVHRDQRNHDMSFKSFAATYEEPAFRSGQKKYTGGRYIRKCLLRYYPNDRTAQIVTPNEGRCLDQRADIGGVPKNINVGKPPSITSLPTEFLRERHLCQKWTPKGSTPRSGSILASSVMETGDFNAVPRSGKAIDFIYRMSLFERPMVDLNGKRFTVHDSASVGPHRADASSLEMSDAALSMVLLTIGDEWDSESNDSVGDTQDTMMSASSSIEMGSDGYPIVWMKYTRKEGEKNITDVKSYRTSLVRAALMVTSARQDAQLQCLMKCVRAGSARSATKQRTEAYLQPTARLLDHANSPVREKQSTLLRDLKLGMNHIDRGQLTRNGILNPRFPTEIQGLIAKCEGAAQVKDSMALAVPGMGSPTVTMYKIRCCALVKISDIDLTGEDLTPFMSPDGSIPSLFREEWVIYRPMKDIQMFHKHLKTQVAIAEQTASAGARLVGAATAAFTVSGHQGSNRRRKVLIPSLGQAQKGGGLVMSKKMIQKRCSLINEYFQYLLSVDHPLNRCSELLMFLGAFYPFPPDVVSGGDAVTNKSDPLGRLEMKREIFASEIPSSGEKSPSRDSNASIMFKKGDSNAEDVSVSTIRTEVTVDGSIRSVKLPSELSRSPAKDGLGTQLSAEEKKARVKEIDMIPAIKAKIDEVPLAQVRSALFELVRYQFDFDNANFFRSRVFATLKTMSFAVASSGEFRKMLYEAHLEYLNADAVADWIKFLIDMIFPDGVFLEFSSPTPEDELLCKKQQAKAALPKAFPDQLRSVLGNEIVNNGLDMLHEMLQNRVILKSMSYMLFDLLWAEVFPELHDILTGPSTLESDY
eukprot:CAMPEP_0178929910 /NCGR_PEP_ID=MMETSP0786-20121207/20914_1 /TAXON_ID=186022 /ORGANISM="Thalassionema frauenfeldii, Strain CCMP 1798" /LENGTH=1956 /DNA_ID=CAMNT_0020606323 /DNA_START=32 /DNA_END=5902 /DNA_ORIENTATION=+